MGKDFEHLFMYLLAICISLEKLFNSFVHLFIRLFIFYAESYELFIYSVY
jgi:hypothetical protein